MSTPKDRTQGPQRREYGRWGRWPIGVRGHVKVQDSGCRKRQVLGVWRKRWLYRGSRVYRTVPGGAHILVSPPNGGDAMLGRETRVLLAH